MRLKTLKLNNFKKHKDVTVHFEDGSNMITGPNYAGKSTILEGILVGLFGNSAAPGTLDELIHTGASDFKVELLTTSGLTIVRSAKNSSVARGDSEPFARGHTAVNAAIIDELGLDKRSFMRIFASEQGSPQQLLAMEGAELQRFLENCIGIDELDSFVKEANKRMIEHVGIMNYLAEQVLEDGDLAALQSELESAVQAIVDEKNKVRGLSFDLEKANESHNELHEHLSQTLRANEAVRKYQTALDAFNEMSLRGLYDIDHNASELNRLTELRNQMRDVLRIINDIDVLKTQITAAEGEADAVVPDFMATSSLENQIDSYPPAEKIDTAKLQVGIAEVKSELSQKTQRIKEIKQAIKDSVCPSCNRPLDEADVCQTDLEDEIKALGDSADMLEISLGELDKELKQAELTNQRRDRERSDIIAGLRQQLRAAEAYNDGVRRQINAVDMAKEKLSTLLTRLADAQASLSALPPLEDIAKLDAAIKDEQEKVEFMRQANAAAVANNNEYERRRATLESMPVPEVGVVDTQEIMESLQASKARIEVLTNDMDLAKSRLRNLEGGHHLIKQKLETHEKASERFSESKSLSEIYKSISQVIAKSRGRIVAEAKDAIFAIASEFASACTNGDIEEILVHNDAISYREKGVIRSKRSASGAQKTMIGIGMKLGLVKLTRTSFDCLLLDEISADMDADVSLRCALALQAFCGQSVAVTHRPMDVAGNVIKVG